MRIGSIFETITGATPPTSNIELYGVDYPFYKPADLDNGFYTDSAKDMVSKKGYETGRIVFEGSILVTCIGATIGKTGYVRKTGICNQQINVIQPTEKINSEYVYFYICSGYEQSQIKLNASATTLPILNKSNFDKLLLALPPFNEQHKITVQIKQALRLIDEIQNAKNEISSVISVLKSKILDLAIRGKLVPQNQDDEPASVLLERIKAQKEELIKQGKIKRDKKESVIFKGDDNSYYIISGENKELLDDWDVSDIPKSWAICTLGDICDYGNCIKVNADKIKDDEWVLDLEDIEKDTGVVLKKVRNSERKSTSTKHKFFKGQVLYSKLRPYLNKVVFADDDGYCTSEILPLNLPSDILPQYVRYYMMSPTFLKYANKCSYGVKMPRLGTDDGKKAVFMFPSFEEQKRIVEAIETAFEQLDNILNSI